ncbi:uncharacterized protein LOC117317045 [Pecten maximus]|uniref:uncharacterized protein LOC117317045 n=1 Tax=Pecten maximus TaxID=6579 RepID=UPI001458E210|nr:uncharacterized protein LOC117317045 [Pecten maximus]XP_033727721.1 uncharacterized protein LOC117317045 [Pecten maximus]
MSETANKSMFYCRMGTGLGLTALTLVFLTVADIAIAVTYKNILDDNDTSCALKAAYSLFVIATIGQFVMGVFDTVLVCTTVRTNVSCHCVCYHMKVITHFISCGMIFMGTMIYGIKDPDKIGYSFWMALIAGFFALMNALMWLLTQQTKRFLHEAGVNVTNLEKGKKHDGSEFQA